MLLLSFLRAIPQRRYSVHSNDLLLSRGLLSCSALRHNWGSFHMGQEVDLFFTSRLSRARCSARCLRPCSITGEHPFNIQGHFSKLIFLLHFTKAQAEPSPGKPNCTRVPGSSSLTLTLLLCKHRHIYLYICIFFNTFWCTLIPN